MEYTKQLSGVNKEIADVSSLINKGIKEIKAQKGDMPTSSLITYLNSTFQEVNDTLTNLNNTKTYLQADLKMATEMAFANYGAVQKDIEVQQDIKKEVFKANLGLLTKQAEFDQEIAQKAQAMNDPATAISTMVDEYKKLGIPFTRSTQQIITDFKTSGQDLATYLSSLQGKIQSKPEYQSYKDKQTGTEWQSTSITRYNPAT